MSSEIQESMELRAAFEVQQDLAAACALNSEVVWDVLSPDQPDILIRKLECMFPDGKKVCASKAALRSFNKHNANVKETRAKLFNNIWQQRKYTNGALLHSIIYVIVTPELDLEKAKLTRNYTIHPIFRTKRCLRKNTEHISGWPGNCICHLNQTKNVKFFEDTNSSAGCCMIFIDEKSRIYQNWNDFVKNNELPVGTMIAPTLGCYSFNDKNQVLLELCFTPAYYYQTIATIDNVVAAASVVGHVATLLSPAFALLTIGTKAYETIRDYQKMSDKIERGTTTQLNANLNLTSNIVCLTSSAVTYGAYMTVPTGEALSFTANMSIQAINSAATLINGTKLVLTTYDIFTRYFIDEEELDFTDLMAFGSSLILFTHSINNMVITSQLGKIGGNTLRNLLQTKIKDGLTLISAEAMKYGGNCDLIRLVNDIPCKLILRDLHTIYENLTHSGFLATLSIIGSGSLEVLPGLLVQVVNKEITEFDLIELSKHYGSKFVNNITNSDTFTDILNSMGEYFSSTVVELLLNETRSFIEKTVDAIELEQPSFVSTEIILYKMFSYTLKNYKNYTYEFLDKNKDDILLGVTKYFQSLNSEPLEDENNVKNSCDICGGYYYLTKV